MFIITEESMSRATTIIEAININTGETMFVDKVLDDGFRLVITPPNSGPESTFKNPIELSRHKNKDAAVETFNEILKALDNGRAYYDTRRILS